MNRLTYAEQLRHPNWQRRRLEMLATANFRCSSCLDGEHPLHVHHKKYRAGALPWEYEDAELEVLCKACHDAEHGIVSGLDAIRRMDEAWRQENPDDAAAFDAEKARQIQALTARVAQ